MIYDKHNETHDKYVQAIKALDHHNMVSEYKKVPDTREEVAFMQETNQAMSSTMFGLNISEERYNQIFKANDFCIDTTIPGVTSV